jgi:hypothetical protein
MAPTAFKKSRALSRAQRTAIVKNNKRRRLARIAKAKEAEES